MSSTCPTIRWEWLFQLPPARVALLLGMWLLASGCSLPPWAHNGFQVGPDYGRPTAAIADDWIDSDDPRVIDRPPEYADWWSVFHDPVLDQLVYGCCFALPKQPR